MTEKKEQILSTALALFAEEGFAATSTSKIAKKAGVSEGLIFRHFGSKKKLLKVLMEETQENIYQLFTPIFNETNAKEVLKKTINLPFTIEKKHYNYWQLQYKLRWEPEYTNSDKFIPILNKFEDAFKKLNYENPKHEAMMLNHILNSVAIDILLNRFDPTYVDFLKVKYQL
ncbi:TetR/AcrR family transcriptional regulator [Wenyingzhuangia sp. IMCC45574]